MRLALDLAVSRPASAAPDVPVGAVVLDPQGVVVGRGRNRREADADPTAHAEVVALRAAARTLGGWRLAGCTLVVTLEPCTMCAGAVLAARISRLVYGAADERAGAAGSRWDLLHDRRLGPPVEVIAGVLAADCAAPLRKFFGDLRTGTPDPDTPDPDTSAFG
ncbi:MAG: nucleoside deaminase [Streptosporangiaceae bacterium]